MIDRSTLFEVGQSLRLHIFFPRLSILALRPAQGFWVSSKYFLAPGWRGMAIPTRASFPTNELLCTGVGSCDLVFTLKNAFGHFVGNGLILFGGKENTIFTLFSGCSLLVFLMSLYYFIESNAIDRFPPCCEIL